MGPLTKRQYWRRSARLSSELRRNLVWRPSSLWELAPGTAPLEQLTPVGAHADAQGRGLIDAVYHVNRRVAARANLLEWMCKTAVSEGGESPIFLYELRESVLMVDVVNTRNGPTPRTCVLCVDNSADVAALIKGSSSPDHVGVLVNLFWNVAALGNARW